MTPKSALWFCHMNCAVFTGQMTNTLKRKVELTYNSGTMGPQRETGELDPSAEKPPVPADITKYYLHIKEIKREEKQKGLVRYYLMYLVTWSLT